MKLFEQTKTFQGRIPVDGATVVPDVQGRMMVAFNFADPQVLASRASEAASEDSSKEDSPMLAPESPMGIEDLAVLRTQAQMLRMAARSGPLFARSAQESLDDWQCAIAVANCVVTMQEVLNHVKAPVGDNLLVVKSVVSAPRADVSFSIYASSFEIGQAGRSDYVASMPRLPLLKKFGQEGSFDYVLMSSEEEEGRVVLSTFLLSFEREISPYDFAAVAAYFSDDSGATEEVLTQLAHYAEIDPSTAMGLLSDEENLTVQEASIDEADYPHLQRLVYAFISLHLQGVKVDVFSSTENDSFMAFGNYLSYLWYGFAKKLGQVKVGYCERCGEGFSLTGHRGIKRRFCSQECKTKAKNDRSKRARENARDQFLSQGRSVNAIAESLYPSEDSDVSREHVLTQLRTWKKLQFQLDAAIVQRGDERLELLQRCINEGILTSQDVLARAEYLKRNPRAVKVALAKVAANDA